MSAWYSRLLCAGLALALDAAPPVALKDGWYYVQGRRTMVNALGYEPGARPGEVPYEKRVSHLDQVRRDLKVIREAGFNAIRTWSELTEPELRLVQASGLKVVFGIWLPPDEDFGDPKIVAKDLARIRAALAYTRKYDCVITYLVMNEPMPEHLRKVGAQATRDLWTQAVALIHTLHPGVPVTISGNSAITEWVDLNLFDVYGRNAYDYGDGAHFTHGFAQAHRAIHESLGGAKPSLLTEFGRSVSRKGSARYGGNTLQEQADALVKYYRDILDSGATGLCPFYYADGWWKAGEAFVHNDEAEEWFGFFGYRDARDTVGTARPAWHALRQYNQALVASPKNQEYYRNTVPFDVFCQPAVKKLRILHQDRVLLETAPTREGRCEGALSFAREPLRDRELVFEAWDGQGRLLKCEVLTVLTGPDALEWPKLELRTAAGDLADTPEVAVTVSLGATGPFRRGDDLRLAFSHHQGWDRAEARTRKLDPQAPAFAVQDSYRVPVASPMLAIYAGVDLHFGKFTRTIGAQRYLYRGPWADPLRVK